MCEDKSCFSYKLNMINYSGHLYSACIGIFISFQYFVDSCSYKSGGEGRQSESLNRMARIEVTNLAPGNDLALVGTPRLVLKRTVCFLQWKGKHFFVNEIKWT